MSWEDKLAFEEVRASMQRALEDTPTPQVLSCLAVHVCQHSSTMPKLTQTQWPWPLSVQPA